MKVCAAYDCNMDSSIIRISMFLFPKDLIQLFNATRNLHPLSTKLLLFGDSGLSHHENVQIVEAVHQFIKSTKRFQ